MGSFAAGAGTKYLTFTGESPSFTNATVTGNLTLSGGTANGVLYLNGSKVATSGSTLTFDGIGNLEVAAAASTAGFTIDAGPGWDSALTFQTNNVSTAKLTAAAAGSLIFAANGTSEQMRLNSTGLGIGTNNPVYKLDVVGAARASTDLFVGQDVYLTRAFPGPFIGTNTAAPIRFGVNNGEAMRLDASGNLGLGVTPSAWGAARKAIQVVNPGQIVSNSITMEIGANWYHNGTNYIYTSSNPVSLYSPSNGAHGWYTAPSGTAGNAISFTQAMTLDANGNLLLGQTSPIYSSSGRGLIEVNGSTNALIALNVGGASAVYFYALGSDFTVWNDRVGYIRFGTGQTERARILPNSPTLILGNGETSATPTDSGINATSGSGTDIAGASLTIRGGRGSGSGAGGSIIFTTALAGASGTALNASTERVRIKQQGQMRFIPLAADPAGAENGDVYYNSTTNKLRVYAGGAWVDLH